MNLFSVLHDLRTWVSTENVQDNGKLRYPAIISCPRGNSFHKGAIIPHQFRKNSTAKVTEAEIGGFRDIGKWRDFCRSGVSVSSRGEQSWAVIGWSREAGEGTFSQVSRGGPPLCLPGPGSPARLLREQRAICSRQSPHHVRSWCRLVAGHGAFTPLTMAH